MLAGAVVLYRNQLPWMIVALGAMHGSFMISYSTAKAEAMGAASQVAASTDSGICLDCLRKAAHFGSPTVIRE